MEHISFLSTCYFQRDKHLHTLNQLINIFSIFYFSPIEFLLPLKIFTNMRELLRRRIVHGNGGLILSSKIDWLFGRKSIKPTTEICIWDVLRKRRNCCRKLSKANCSRPILVLERALSSIKIVARPDTWLTLNTWEIFSFLNRPMDARKIDNRWSVKTPILRKESASRPEFWLLNVTKVALRNTPLTQWKILAMLTTNRLYCAV